jgi:pimeloyl-ACP methyl ester carboxylesterase
VYPEYPYDSRFVSHDGVRQHYIDEGNGQAIVMVHGNPTWSYFYRNLIDRFRSTHRVIAVDHAGCGLSDKPQDYNYCLRQHIDNLERLLAHAGVDKFSLVVHDWGGAIGFGLAVKQPSRIQRIAVLNTAAFRSTRIPLRISVCRIPVVGEIAVRLFNGFARPALRMAVVRKMAPEVAAAYIAPYDSWKNRVAIHNFVKDIPLEPDHKSYRTLAAIEEKLEDIRDAGIPLKVIWGGRDFCFNDYFYNEWKKRFPDAEFHYFEDGGHYLLEDKKDEVAALLDGFFEVKTG